MSHGEDYDGAGGLTKAAADEQYFESYGTDMAVTRVMLDDRPRMDFYRAVLDAENVRGKVVVDVGAGTGVLSMWAARHGAKKVIAVEASSMAHLLRRILAANAAQTRGVVHVAHCTAETLSLAALRERGLLGADEAVDVVVSEWMGFYLLHEGLFFSVIHARDALLAAPIDAGAVGGGGAPALPLLLPSRATLWLAPVDMRPLAEARVRGYWRDVDGFDLSPIADEEVDRMLAVNPVVQQLPVECLVCEPIAVCEFDLTTITAAELQTVVGAAAFDYGGSALARRTAAERPGATVQGFAVWFDVAHGDTTLRTGPADAPTHWKQSVAMLPAELRDGALGVAALVADGDVVGVQLTLQCDAAHRCYELGVQLFDPSEQ
jgi:hypothetical protein